MASPKLDSLNIRRFNETVNLYDDGKSQGTACEKTLASRVSGVSFNILSNKNTFVFRIKFTILVITTFQIYVEALKEMHSENHIGRRKSPFMDLSKTLLRWLILFCLHMK